jgi:hypothetical protein
MNNSENEILISAYLDDELTADERARVEQLLATNTEARQLLDEMRAIRSKLQELPQHRLEMDFAQTVLQKAQHQNAASQPTDISASIPHSPFPTPHSDSPLAPHHSLFRKRGLAWSLAAIAAAVLITITTKRSDQNRQLAQRAEPPIVRAPANAEQEITTRSKLASEQGEMKPLAEAAHSASAWSQIPAPQPSVAARKESANERLADTPAPTTNNIANNKDTDNLHFSLQGERRDGTTSDKELPDAQQSTPLATDDRSLFKSDTSREAKSFSAPGTVGGKLQIPSQAITSNESPTNSPAAGSAIQLKDANAPQSTAGEAEPILMVHADISSEAARQGAFDQLLSQNNIALSSEKQKVEPQEYRRFRGTTQLGIPSPSQQSLDVIYVEAAPAQIQNALTGLRKSPSQFSSITVTNLPDKQNLKLDELSDDKKDAVPTLGRAARIALPVKTLDGLIAGDNSTAFSEEKASDKNAKPSDTAKPSGALPSSDAPAAPFANSLSRMYSGQTAPIQQRALFVLRIIDAPIDTDSAKPSAPAAAKPSSPAQSPAILPSGK